MRQFLLCFQCIAYKILFKIQYSELNTDELYFMLDSMIRYDQINSTFERWYSEDTRNFEAFVKTSDLLRLFRSVSK